MIDKTIETGCYGIVVELVDEILHSLTPNTYSGGSISSDLKEACPICHLINCIDDSCLLKIIADFGEEDGKEDYKDRQKFNDMMDALESIILAHAMAGIDITTPAYLEGIETACGACAKATE